MLSCSRHSKLELPGPRNSLKISTQSSGGVRSAPFLAQMPNLPTKEVGGRAGGASRGDSESLLGRLMINPMIVVMPIRPCFE
eukprot:12629926-Alexandrium_andersonii.AAC.1